MATLDTAGQFSSRQGLLLLLLTLASSRSKRSGLLQKSHSTEEPEVVGQESRSAFFGLSSSPT